MRNMRAAERFYLQGMRRGIAGRIPAVGCRGRTARRRRDGGLVNADALLWIALVALVASTLAAIGARVLRDFSRHQLQEICEQRQQLDRFGDIVRHHEETALGVEIDCRHGDRVVRGRRRGVWLGANRHGTDRLDRAGGDRGGARVGGGGRSWSAFRGRSSASARSGFCTTRGPVGDS